MARLEVQIGADNKDLQAKLAKSIKLLDQLKKEEQELTKAFKQGKIASDKYYDSLAKNATRVNKVSSIQRRLKTNIQTGSKTMQQFGKSTAYAVPAVTEFSRVIQDAPFGIQGVANNITQLTQQFGHLSTKTGGAKNALKAMLGTLAGPAGILLAVSAVTSLLVAFGDKIFQTNNKVKSLKEEQDKLKESLDNYALGLEAVNRANLKGEQTAQKEIVKLNQLRSVVENSTLSIHKRRTAINELRKIYPDYFKNLSEEKLLSGGLSSVYDNLTTSIIKRAKATAAMNAIVKNSEKLLNLENQLATKNDEVKKKKVQLENAEALAVKRAGKERSANNFSVERAIKLRKEYNQLLQESTKIQGQIQGIQLENIDLEFNIDSFGGVVPDVSKIRPRIKSAFDILSQDYRNNIETNSKVVSESSGLFSKKFKEAYGNAFKLNTQAIGEQLTSDTEFIKEKLNELNQGVTQIVNNNLVRSFGSIGDAIGNSLSGVGNISENLSKALLGSIGSLLTQLGQMAIMIGVSLEKIKIALTSLNPAVAIAAGVGLIAIGKFFSSKSAAIGGQIGGGSRSSSGGGSVSSGVGGATSQSFGSSSSFTGSSNGFGEVVFRIAGTDLVGVLSNTLERNRNLGGQLSIS